MDAEQGKPDTAGPDDREQIPSRHSPSTGALWLTAGAPVAISLLSLVLSVYTIVQANRDPEIWLSAPDVVRLAAGDRAWFYVQPRFVSAAGNDRVAVVSGLRLEVRTPDGAEIEFWWDEQGSWRYEPPFSGLTWIYIADPAPLVVGPSSPQLPTCLFVGPAGWRWQPGTYRVAIVAGRGDDPDALRTEFSMTFPESDLNPVYDPENPQWVEARTVHSPPTS